MLYRANRIAQVAKKYHDAELDREVAELRATLRQIREDNWSLREQIRSLQDCGNSAECQKAKEALLKSESMQRGILDSTSDFIWSVDAENFRMMTFNKASEDYNLQQWGVKLEVGLTPEEVTGLGASQDSLRAEYSDRWRKAYRKVLDEGPYTVEYVTISGMILLLTFNPLTISGLVFGVSVFGKDITDRKKAENIAKENEALQRELLSNLVAGVVIIDPQTRIIEQVNSHVETLFGASADHLVGHRCNYLLCPAAEGACPVCDLGKTIDNTEREMLRADGSRIPILKTVRRIQLNGKEKVLECFVDLSERKRAEQDRIVLSKLESTGILAGGIAHDFNNLLGAILLNLDLLKPKEHPDPRNAEFVETIRSSTLAARNLTKQLITFAKGGAPVRKPMHLGKTIESAIMLALSGSNILSSVEVSPDLSWTEADEGQIGQVLRNLLLNARDAMPCGGKIELRAENHTISPQAESKLAPGNYVRVKVSDNGAGIPPDVLSKIFDPYFSTKERGSDKGMGLGLTICHTIIQKHGGVIEVSSQLGQGTTFQFYLPACPALA